jgi:hypothetical protein
VIYTRYVRWRREKCVLFRQRLEILYCEVRHGALEPHFLTYRKCKTLDLLYCYIKLCDRMQQILCAERRFVLVWEIVDCSAAGWFGVIRVCTVNNTTDTINNVKRFLTCGSRNRVGSRRVF